MKDIFISVLIALLFGCMIDSCKENRHHSDALTPDRDTLPEQNGHWIDKRNAILIVDSCEYLIHACDASQTRSMCHKGDCKNKIHSQNKNQ